MSSSIIQTFCGTSWVINDAGIFELDKRTQNITKMLAIKLKQIIWFLRESKTFAWNVVMYHDVNATFRSTIAPRFSQNEQVLLYSTAPKANSDVSLGR
mmetsp:Transcript_20310/g.42511  ORF Transcript_20310/g.42511 Transcript_20310/m.42511 type:complete len:98 (+) Transcript_20310:516-809(+)